MAKESRITSVARDIGDVKFHADFQRAVMVVSVREPLAIASTSAEIPIVDFIEISARLLLDSCDIQRALQAQLLAKAQHSAKPAS